MSLNSRRLMVILNFTITVDPIVVNYFESLKDRLEFDILVHTMNTQYQDIFCGYSKRLFVFHATKEEDFKKLNKELENLKDKLLIDEVIISSNFESDKVSNLLKLFNAKAFVNVLNKIEYLEIVKDLIEGLRN